MEGKEQLKKMISSNIDKIITLLEDGSDIIIRKKRDGFVLYKNKIRIIK